MKKVILCLIIAALSSSIFVASAQKSGYAFPFQNPALPVEERVSDLVFWGGGVNTQHTLKTGTPQQVSDEVKKIIDIMAPGGGFVFSTVHNIQEDVPPENFWAMWETLIQYGKY